VLSQTAPALAAGGAVTAVQARGSVAQHAAAAMAAGTTVETAGVAPAVVSLADAATISIDASQGNDFRLTLGGNHTLATPANPSDGQKITLQVTQGSGGPYTLGWGSGYSFSTGLPQPTLSTTVGNTDLLGFIYNQAKGKWLLAAFVSGFSQTVVVQAKGTYRLFPATNGPASPVSYSGPFTCGVAFSVTTGGCWLDGFWWWVCDSGQSTAAQKFALWCQYGQGENGSLVGQATVTSGALTAGQWNYVALTSPVPLAIGAVYIAATGFTGPFPDTDSQWGSGDPYSAGIVAGPLTAYSDTSGSKASVFDNAQNPFSVSTSDPTSIMPVYGTGQANNFWLDVLVDTNAPAGTSYRLWPSYPTVPGHVDSDTAGYTLATEFQLSQSCQLGKIWFYSASGATALPSRCAIWNVSSQAEVSGTDNSSPSWSGAAGSGWVSCSYSGVTLPAGDYKVAVFNGGGSEWYQATVGYWNGSGIGASGITTGPVTAPGASAATSPGQSTYNAGSWGYPQSYSSGNGENYWIDVEVTPS
jgi:hypothetical protein